MNGLIQTLVLAVFVAVPLGTVFAAEDAGAPQLQGLDLASAQASIPMTPVGVAEQQPEVAPLEMLAAGNPGPSGCPDTRNGQPQVQVCFLQPPHIACVGQPAADQEPGCVAAGQCTLDLTMCEASGQ